MQELIFEVKHDGDHFEFFRLIIFAAFWGIDVR